MANYKINFLKQDAIMYIEQKRNKEEETYKG